MTSFDMQNDGRNEHKVRTNAPAVYIICVEFKWAFIIRGNLVNIHLLLKRSAHFRNDGSEISEGSR